MDNRKSVIRVTASQYGEKRFYEFSTFFNKNGKLYYHRPFRMDELFDDFDMMTHLVEQLKEAVLLPVLEHDNMLEYEH